MANIRYRADWTTMDGFEYRVDIIDTEYDSTPNSLEIGMDSLDGFKIDYQGENNNLFNPVLTSECIINCVATDSTFETFIDDMIGAQEQRFFVLIYKKVSSTYQKFWVGLVVQNLIQLEDIELPYLFQIHATDGIARLKFEDYPAVLSTYETCLAYIINSLTKTGLTQFWDTETFLRTAVNWYEKSMYSTAPADSLDPLAVTRFENQALMKAKDNTDIEYVSCYDLLVQMGVRWGATLTQVDGRFNFFQVNEMAKTTIKTRDYNKSGTYLSVNTADDYHVTTVGRQGTFSFLPALNTVKITYDYKQSMYASNLLPPQSNYTSPVSFGTVQGGTNNEKLLFTGQVRSSMRYSGTWQPHAWVFHMRLQVGDYYYTNQNGYPEWTTTTSARYICQSPFIYDYDYNFYWPITFETLDIIEDGEGVFEFDFIKFVGTSGQTLVPPPTATYYHQTLNFNINQNILDEIENGSVDYEAVNLDASSTPVESKTILSLPKVITGDGYHLYSDGALEVYHSFNYQQSNEEWHIYPDLTDFNINTLVCSEAIARQRKPLRVFTGDVWGLAVVFTPINIITLGSKKYFMRSASFNANLNQWTGDWVELEVTRTTISTQQYSPATSKQPFATASGGDSFVRLQYAVEKNKFGNRTESVSALVTADYSIKEEEGIIYVIPAASGVNITLPAYDDTTFKMYRIINASATLTINIRRDDSADLINGSAADFTLPVDSALTIHNSGISSIGWATIDKSSRK